MIRGHNTQSFSSGENITMSYSDGGILTGTICQMKLCQVCTSVRDDTVLSNTTSQGRYRCQVIIISLFTFKNNSICQW